jgi:adenylate cyclase
MRSAREQRSVDLLHLSVGFVDLVGFTELSRKVSARDLAALVAEFEGVSNDIVTARDGRLVKLIGDEVMFVAVDAAAACDAALSLVERFAGHQAVTPRAGLAAGPLLMRGGDYYGPIVNLASRIAELAVPKEVLVTEQLVAAAGAQRFRFEPAGKRMLKGFDEPFALFAAVRR